MKRHALWILPLTLALLLHGIAVPADEGADAKPAGTKTASSEKPKKKEKIVKSDAQWRKQLSRMQYRVTRQGATEKARTGRYWRHKEKGTYLCVCCSEPLFASKTKFKSGTGWPSFWAPVEKEQVATKVDRSNFFLGPRMEVLCSRCDAHLGHVFNDGPRPTGLRYCINSAALKFAKEKKPKATSDKDTESEDTAKEADSAASATKRTGTVSKD